MEVDLKCVCAPWCVELCYSLSTGTPVRKEQLEGVAEQLSVADITEFLKTVAKLQQYTVLFEENDIDGAVLFGCTIDMLKDLGVANSFHCNKIIAKFKQHLQAKFGQYTV